jgi:hypothetical protein
MNDWKKIFWRSELQQFIKDCLKTGDMTLQEIATVIQKTAKVRISAPALAAILKVTDGVKVKTKIFSDASNKMINVYSIAFHLDKEQQ